MLVDARLEADYYLAYAETFKPVKMMTLAMTVPLFAVAMIRLGLAGTVRGVDMGEDRKSGE